MPIAKVSSHYQGSTDTAVFTTTGINTVGATAILVAVCQYEAPGPATIIDSVSNDYGAPITSEIITSGARLQVWVKASPTTNASHTFTMATAYAPSIAILALTGTAAAAVVDQFSDAQVAASTTVQPGSITPSQNDCAVVTAYASATVVSSLSPYAIDGQIGVDANHFAVALGFEIQTTATARNPTWTAIASSNHIAAIVSLKAPAAGGPDLSVQLEEPTVVVSVF